MNSKQRIAYSTLREYNCFLLIVHILLNATFVIKIKTNPIFNNLCVIFKNWTDSFSVVDLISCFIYLFISDIRYSKTYQLTTDNNDNFSNFLLQNLNFNKQPFLNSGEEQFSDPYFNGLAGADIIYIITQFNIWFSARYGDNTMISMLYYHLIVHHFKDVSMSSLSRIEWWNEKGIIWFAKLIPC